MIAYFDKTLTLWYLDISKGTPVKVDQNPDGLNSDVMRPFWSPDNKWIGYTKQVDNHLRADTQIWGGVGIGFSY